MQMHPQALRALASSAQAALVVHAGSLAVDIRAPPLLVKMSDHGAGSYAGSAPASLVNITGSGKSSVGKRGPKGRWGMALSLDDFSLGSKLGEGLTGRVHYAKLRLRGLECALKIMRKAKLVELGEEQHVCSELEALDRISSPYVTALLGCFQDAHAVYLAIEYMRGPDLFAYMCVSVCARSLPCFAHSWRFHCRHEINAPTGFERSISMHAVQFYTAQVLLGLDALHSNGYIYRYAQMPPKTHAI